MFEVFISHQSNDRNQSLANSLAENLNARGINCFLDTKNIHGGDSFIRKIINSVREARIVVVFIDNEMSTWVHFEAACAFFDQKLVPVSVGTNKVPMPYRRIQHEVVRVNDDGSFDEDTLERVAEEVQRRLHGHNRDAVLTRVYRRANSLFFSGIPILFAVVSALVLIGVVPGTVYEHVNHLHVILGAAILGGQFFLSLGFARSVSSPSYREREYGFQTTERLFYVWAVLTLAQPVLGLWLVLSENRIYPMHAWVWLSLVFYLLALLATWIGYALAKSARDLDRHHAAPRTIDGRNLSANILFLIGFVLTVAVINLMIKKPDLTLLSV